MSYFDDFKAMSQAKGATMAEQQLHLLQQSFDKYFLETPDRITDGKIDGVDVDFVIQNLKYGEQFNDEKLMLVENSTTVNIGSLIEWDSKIWLCMNQENRAIKTHKAYKLTLCNNTISWQLPNGDIQIHPCYVRDYINGGQDVNKQLPLSESERNVYVQYNQYTDDIYENQRFIFGKKRALKVTDIDDYTRPNGVIMLKMEKDVLLEEDDLVNNIAYNGEVTIPQPTPTTEIQFSSSSLEMPAGLSDTVSVYEYVSGVAQSTTFTFRIDGIDPSKYQILSTTPNSIEILCKEFYFAGQLVAIKDVTLEETSIPLVLKSLF